MEQRWAVLHLKCVRRRASVLVCKSKHWYHRIIDCRVRSNQETDDKLWMIHRFVMRSPSRTQPWLFDCVDHDRVSKYIPGSVLLLGLSAFWCAFQMKAFFRLVAPANNQCCVAQRLIFILLRKIVISVGILAYRFMFTRQTDNVFS